ncbi:MAG: gliding motility-associated C-terminal domain-containing protein [Cyclobacteriaceae bacterium]
MVNNLNGLCKFLTFACCFLLMQMDAAATHIRAGEITAVRISQFSLTYEFTITGFRDSGSAIDFGGGRLSLGDGTVINGPFAVDTRAVGNQIELVTFKYNYTYTAPNGNGYLVSYEEDFRNADIINMDNSVGTTFYVETLIVIDSFFGLNNTPVLTVPPIDFAAVGALFIHNPGAFDPDGDSLSYRFTTPKKGRNILVDNYGELNDPKFYSNFSTGSEEGNPPSLSINAITGDLTWDAPGDAFVDVGGNEEQREYNVAFVVEEWRNVAGTYHSIGFVVRDMQIIVIETDNERPVIEVPDDICIEAGDTAKAQALATDPDGHPIKLEAFGGPFEVANTAIFLPSPANFQTTSPAVIDFEWMTDCSNVRERPYEVQFKATDDPEIGPSLVEFETFQITVAGPPPTGLTTEMRQAKSMQLNWDEYECSEAQLMQIWRKSGSLDIEFDECQIGMPANTGYQMIDKVDILETSYFDNNGGTGLSSGVKYCYRLVAEYPMPAGGLSYVSTEACDSVLIDVPVITNVDIKTTSEVDGQILVRWIPPYQIDQSLYPPSYTYDLFRRSNESGSSFVQIENETLDTVFTDTGLNTKDFQYTYYVRFYEGNGNLVDSSATASSIRLELRPLVQSMELEWSGNVPWSLRSFNQPYHYIYRDRIDEDNLQDLVLIDSVEVTSSPLKYLDIGAVDGKALLDSIDYCYFVTTFGTYENALIPEPLINSSQISCAQPNDTIPPCMPPNLSIDPNYTCEAFLAGKACDEAVYQNKIIWDLDLDPDCGDDIAKFNIYFSPSGEDGSFELIGTSVSTEFIHFNLRSFKGCYRVGAVDRSNNESILTETICNDNCPNISFPNVFTPDNDGINDVYTPKFSGRDIQVSDFDVADCPRFVMELDFVVTDRSGNQVFEYSTKDSNENDFLIRWDGKNKEGLELDAGVYYYSAVVLFDVLDKSQSKRKYNGWIQILK